MQSDDVPVLNAMRIAIRQMESDAVLWQLTDEELQILASAALSAQAEQIEAVADFRGRARICRTNMDAYDEKAASIWDLAADALEAIR